MWFIAVEQETSVPPPKKNPGSAPESESWSNSRRAQVTWKPSLKPTLGTCGFVSFENGESCQSILIMLRRKIALS